MRQPGRYWVRPQSAALGASTRPARPASETATDPPLGAPVRPESQPDASGCDRNVTDMSRIRRGTERAWEAVTIGRLALALAVAAVVAGVANVVSETGRDWTPNIATEALSVLLTIVVVDRIVARRRTEEERERVIQVVRRVSGDLHSLATFTLWDYRDMHPGHTYERPPSDLRGLLAHFKEGLATKEVPWPSDPRILTASKVMADHLEREITRHERVLDHGFVAAAYTYMRSEMMSRNMYLLEEEEDYLDEDDWKGGALGDIPDEVATFLGVFEPYACKYLGADWGVRLRDNELDHTDRIHARRRQRDDA